MKYGQRDIIDLYIFDEDENKVVELISLKQSGIYLNTDKPYVHVKDALLDVDLLKFIGKSEQQNISDYEKTISVQKYKTTVVLSNRNKKKCKLIGRGCIREQETGKDVEFLFEIPCAQVMTGMDFQPSYTRESDFDVMFKILPFNDDGDLIKMHIE